MAEGMLGAMHLHAGCFAAKSSCVLQPALPCMFYGTGPVGMTEELPGAVTDQNGWITNTCHTCLEQCHLTSAKSVHDQVGRGMLHSM